MRILLTGSDGYIGSVAAAQLLADGHEVLGLDTGYYRAGWLYNGAEHAPQTITKDIRHVTQADFEGVDAVVHMAELSNDPLGNLIGDVTLEVNHLGSARLAAEAKRAGVERFVYMSSCSVYGVAEDGVVDERSATNPQTAYALCKTLTERDVTAMADDAFSPTFLRNSTVFGASPRIRFDVVLNNLAGLAWTTGEIAMTSDGSPWRPLVHVRDVVQAIRCVLAAPREAVHAETFNVGSDAQNYQVKEIAEIVAETFPGCRISFGEAGADNRSYRVDFTKISTQLPGFRCAWDAERGARELRDVFRRVDLDAGTFTGRGHTRLKQIEWLLRTGQLDSRLFWVV